MAALLATPWQAGILLPILESRLVRLPFVFTCFSNKTQLSIQTKCYVMFQAILINAETYSMKRTSALVERNYRRHKEFRDFLPTVHLYVIK